MATKCIVLGQSSITCDALKTWTPDIGVHDTDITCIAFEPSQQIAEAGVLAYERLVRKVEEVVMSDDVPALNEVVAMVDAVCPLRLNAAAEYCTWDHLIAMLILTFPEVRWVFGIIQGSCNAHGREEGWFDEVHGLPALIAHERRDSLFDPTGLRDWVLRVTKDELQRAGLDVQMLLRNDLACAVDDERMFAYFHAYAAYRHGFRADAVCSWALMNELFGPNTAKPHDYKLLLEDLSLNFPDKPAKVSLISLGGQGRSASLPQLASEDATRERSECRILITIGLGPERHHIENENKLYLRQKAVGKAKWIHKPVGGIFDLWKATGLSRNLASSAATAINTGATGHGAPGKLLLVAETLLRRADVVSRGGGGVADSIFGAVLAGDALGLLGGRTPSTALDALARKHEMEVRAECQFVGVRHNIEVKERVAEIRRDLELLSGRFPRRTRKATRLDAEVIILGTLVSVFQEHNQFDEELLCLYWQRQGMARLLQARNGVSGWLVGWLWRYLNWLLLGPVPFLFAILAWLLVGTLAFGMAAADFSTWSWNPGSFGHAVDAFFTGNFPSNDYGFRFTSLMKWTVRGMAVSGLFHFGVFISYIYTLMTRK